MNFAFPPSTDLYAIIVFTLFRRFKSKHSRLFIIGSMFCYSNSKLFLFFFVLLLLFILEKKASICHNSLLRGLFYWFPIFKLRFIHWICLWNLQRNEKCSSNWLGNWITLKALKSNSYIFVNKVYIFKIFFCFFSFFFGFF